MAGAVKAWDLRVRRSGLGRDELTELNWPKEGLWEWARIRGKELLWSRKKIMGSRWLIWWLGWLGRWVGW